MARGKAMMLYADGRVVPALPARTNAQRQQDFRDAHPGYDRRRKAHERGRLKRLREQLQAQAWAAEMAAMPAMPATPALAEAANVAQAEVANVALAETAQIRAQAGEELLRIPIPTTRLALPAPVESPAMAALKELPQLLAAAREREARERVVQLISRNDRR